MIGSRIRGLNDLDNPDGTLSFEQTWRIDPPPQQAPFYTYDWIGFEGSSTSSSLTFYTLSMPRGDDRKPMKGEKILISLNHKFYQVTTHN